MPDDTRMHHASLKTQESYLRIVRKFAGFSSAGLARPPSRICGAFHRDRPKSVCRLSNCLARPVTQFASNATLVSYFPDHIHSPY
jgi:hypothetical protein